jgi:hypothetical protein
MPRRNHAKSLCHSECHKNSNARSKNRQQKYFSQSQKNRCVFARLCYSLCMNEKEIQLQALEEKLEQIANDLIDPMLDDQTTVLLHAMRKVREKINALVAE